MQELPEVETYNRYINKTGLNQHIKKAEIYNSKIQDGMKEISQRVAMREIHIEIYNQLRADLQLDTIKTNVMINYLDFSKSE